MKKKEKNMRIGIDIDDCITDIKDELYEEGKKYAKSNRNL